MFHSHFVKSEHKLVEYIIERDNITHLNCCRKLLPPIIQYPFGSLLTPYNTVICLVLGDGTPYFTVNIPLLHNKPILYNNLSYSPQTPS